MTQTFGLALLLLLLAHIPVSKTVINAGQNFTVVFPENIAFYHPSHPQNKIWITALHDNTKIHIDNMEPKYMKAGETKSFEGMKELERVNLSETNSSTLFTAFSISDEAINITSNADIIVQTISIRGKSVQTALVIPNENLSMKYFIPPTLEIEGIPDAAVSVVNVTEMGPFRLIIINPHSEKVAVTFEGGNQTTGELAARKVAQIWVNNVDTPTTVEADKPVAVYLSHPCAMQHNCTCGLLHAILPAAKTDNLTFPIPPVPVPVEQASVLLSDRDSRRSAAFNPASAVARSAGTAILHWPGLLLTLIPEEDFGSCFVVPYIQDKKNYFIIVVHKDHRDGIHIGNDPLEDAEWQELNGTNYVSFNQNISSDRTFIWHNSSKMAVYFMGNMNSRWFGSPAPVISATPDYRGCTLTSENISILNATEDWQISIQSCKNELLDLITLPNENLQKHICSKFVGKDTKKVWIGARRSSFNGDWYWLDNSPFNNTKWAPGKPGEWQEGQCAVMTLKDGNECRWNNEKCCDRIPPLCYSAPKILKNLVG